jgi:hypothetical protein
LVSLTEPRPDAHGVTYILPPAHNDASGGAAMLPDFLTHTGMDRQRRSRGGHATAIKRRAKGKRRRQAEDHLLTAIERSKAEDAVRFNAASSASCRGRRSRGLPRLCWRCGSHPRDLDQLTDDLGVDGLDVDDIVNIVRRARKRQRDEGVLPRKFHRASKKK